MARYGSPMIWRSAKAGPQGRTGWLANRRERQRLERERVEDSPEDASVATTFSEAMDAEIRYAQQLLWGVAIPGRRDRRSPGSADR